MRSKRDRNDRSTGPASGPALNRPLDGGRADPSPSSDGPVRTCVGCRQRDAQQHLVRVVADSAGRLKIDALRREPGRGAYLHPSRKCVEQVLKKEALGRALRRNLVWPVDEGAGGTTPLHPPCRLTSLMDRIENAVQQHRKRNEGI